MELQFKTDDERFEIRGSRNFYFRNLFDYVSKPPPPYYNILIINTKCGYFIAAG